MTDREIAGLGPAFAAYLRRFRRCFRQTRTAGHFDAYCRGLLSDLPRKTVEPIALAAGTAVRTLQEFLVTAKWDHARARATLQRHLGEVLAGLPADPLGTVGVIDETSCRKWGDHTPGVQRQYLGCVGKLDHGIVTVHVGVTNGTFQALLDADLYLPKDWDADRERCRAAGIPDDVRYRPKWRIALAQLVRLEAAGVRPDWLVFDEGYGAAVPMLRILDLAGRKFVAEVPVNFAVRDPDQTSDALGAAAVQLGPNMLALAADLKHRLGLSYRKAAEVIRTLTGEAVSPGGLARTGRRLRELARPTYQSLVDHLRAAPVKHADETGWRVGGRSAWLWVFADAAVTVYRVRPSRGHDVVVEVLGEDITGVLVASTFRPSSRMRSRTARRTASSYVARGRTPAGEVRNVVRHPHRAWYSPCVTRSQATCRDARARTSRCPVRTRVASRPQVGHGAFAGAHRTGRSRTAGAATMLASSGQGVVPRS